MFIVSENVKIKLDNQVYLLEKGDKIIVENQYYDDVKRCSNVIVQNVDLFLSELRDWEQYKSQEPEFRSGKMLINKDLDIIHVDWTVNFAGGDFTLAELDEIRQDKDFEEWLKEYPLAVMVGGNCMDKEEKRIAMRVQFNPFKIFEYINSSGKDYYRNIEATIFHEIAHLPQPSYSRYGARDFNYFRLPWEVDANIQVMVDIYNLYGPMSFDELLAKLPQHNIKQCYSTPKWRKKIRSVLAKRGIIIRK